MKTPNEWIEEFQSLPGWIDSNYKINPHAIEAIQRDALSDPMACTTDQQELEMMKAACDKLELDVQYWKESWALMREKWHEARRYLRAANKGAERNNQVMRLQSYDISKLCERIKHLEQQINQ